jgi:hypothetical protein
MQLLAPSPNDHDEVCFFENREMLGHRLPGHLQMRAKLPERLAVLSLQAIQQETPPGIGQRLEHLVHGSHYATFWLPVKLEDSRIGSAAITESFRNC